MSSCLWNLGFFPNDARKNCPFVLTSFTGWSSERCPGINGILSGAILSWVAIVTELSSSIILYSNKSITLTMSTYLAILRGNDGIAAAFAAILTVVTTLSLLLYLKVSKSEDVRL